MVQYELVDESIERKMNTWNTLVIIHLSQVGTMWVIRYGLSCELLQLLVCRIRNPELHKEARQNYGGMHGFGAEASMKEY